VVTAARRLLQSGVLTTLRFSFAFFGGSECNRDFSPSERQANVGAKIETATSSRTTDGKAMPVPAEYQRATDDFYKLLKDARDSADLTTTNQAYTMVQGVFQAFRRRFEDRAIMTKEVQALRSEHNYAPETAIRNVAIALRRNLDQAAFDRVLTTLPQGATQFWQPE
jgi:uncharacterized protein (DUF2267 family)